MKSHVKLFNLTILINYDPPFRTQLKRANEDRTERECSREERIKNLKKNRSQLGYS